MRLAAPVAIALLCAGSGWSAPAMASDFGCTVLLCLSNSGGPMQYAACAQPIEKLWTDLAEGEPFPGCSESGVADTEVKGRRGSASSRVTMTYRDGSKQTYSLASLASDAAPIDGVPATRGDVQP